MRNNRIDNNNHLTDFVFRYMNDKFYLQITQSVREIIAREIVSNILIH